MKKGLIIGIILGVLFLLLIIGLVVLVFILPGMIEEKKIENISHLYFSYTSGYAMYSYSTYELNCTDKCILTVKPNGVPDEEKKEVEIPKEKVKELESKLNEYHVTRWHGFNKNDKNVLDGDSFSFNLDYGDKKIIRASGYMMWPNNYSNVKSYIVNKFNEYIKEK